MGVLLKKHLLLRPFSLNLPLLLRKLSSLAPATQNPSPQSSFITNYLVESCGFSPQKATTASRLLRTITSAENPESVRHFLKQLDCSDADVRSIISNHPTILHADLDKTVKPNLEAIRRSVQLSEPQILKLIVSAPPLLTNRRTVPRLQFWKDFVGGDTKKLMLLVTRNRGLVSADDNSVTSKIALLTDHGLSKEDIVKLLSFNFTNVFTKTVPALELLLKRVRELGLEPNSSMFVYGLACLSSNSTDTFKAKVEVFKSLGWSETEFISAFKKYPQIIIFSKDTIQKKMEFFVGTAGCSPSYIASYPIILSFSVGKRLIPRYRVISCLKMNKSISKEPHLFVVMKLSDENFVNKFILPFKEIEPKLLEIYAGAAKVELQTD